MSQGVMMAFRLNPDTQPPEVKVRSIFSSAPPIQGAYSLINGATEMRFPIRAGEANPFAVDHTGKTNRSLVNELGNGNELILRRDAPDAPPLLKTLAEQVYPLAERKKYLQQVTPETLFATQASEELALMPTDEEIREIDAEFALMIVERDPPGQRKQTLQAIIDKYDETKAAQEALQLLSRLPADEEIRELEAVFALWTAERDPPGRRKRALQAIIAEYDGTKAAEEASQLLATLPSDEELRKMQAEIAREIDAEIALKNAEQAPLGQRGQALQAIIEKYDGTKATEKASQWLPGIREIEAEDALKTAEQASLGQRRQAFQAIIEKYDGTKAADEARRRLPGIRKMVAQSLVDAAKKEMEVKPRSARWKLEEAIELYPGVLAAAEAEGLFRELDEDEAAEQLRQAKLLLESNPTTARDRLPKIIEYFPKTKAAAEAQRLLK